MDDFIGLMLRRPKKEYQEASIPGLANPVIEVSGELEGRVICDLPVHEGIDCDGILCVKKAEDDQIIRGNRFKCLQCDDTDFCETCVLSPDNAHDSSHLLLKMAPPSECAVCRDMNIPETRMGYKEYTSDVEVFNRVAEEKRCGNCAFVWALFSQFPPEEGWPPIKEKVTIRFRRYAFNCFDFAVLSDRGKTTTEDEMYVHTIQKVQDSEYRLQVYPILPWSHEDLEDAHPETKATIARVTSYSGSPEAMGIAQNWLETCRINHTECNFASKDSLPTRLIELRTEEPDHVFLLDTTGLVSADYAALSYCWGTGEKGVETTLAKLHEFQEEGLVIEDLPATVRDAVRVAETLGLRYLWIDRLCIVQDDEDDWTRESSKMCSIYEGAVLTISADGSTSVWDGIFRYQDYATMEYQPFLENILVTKRQYHEDLEDHISGKTQPLHVRAWTLQERLMSRRIIHFTSNELVWECNRKCECECRRQSEPSYRRLVHRHLGDMVEIFSEWRAVVMDYTSRSLTKDFDKLPALSGLVTKFQNSMRQVAGSSDAYLAGLWCSNLADELSWKTPTIAAREAWLRNNPPLLPASDSKALEDDADRPLSRAVRQLTINDWRRPKKYVAPSWSWASVRGPISYLGCEPPAPVKSYIDLIKTNSILKSELQPNGQILDASITMRGYVARDLQLSAMQGVFASRDGTELVKEIIFITAADEYILEFAPDDPTGVVRKYGGNIHSVSLLLLGSRDILLGRPVKISGVSLEEVRVSKIKKGSLGLKDSGGGDSLPASEDQSPSGDSAEIDQDLREVFRIENDGIVPEGEITRWSSYLVLAPCSDRANKYVRLGCFDTGLRRVDREVMEGVFRNAKREEITII